MCSVSANSSRLKEKVILPDSGWQCGNCVKESFRKEVCRSQPEIRMIEREGHFKKGGEKQNKNRHGSGNGKFGKKQ